MFFYLLKNSTIIEPELNDNTRNTKILIYGTVAYIILHATLFIGGEEALLNCLKPYFWLFVILDVSIISINSDIDFKKLISNNTNNKKPKVNSINTSPTNKINNVFDSFLKNTEIDGNERIKNKSRNSEQESYENGNVINTSQLKMGNPHIKRKNIVKKVRFEEQDNFNTEYQSSSDSDIGTDIDIDSFKESLNYIE